MSYDPTLTGTITTHEHALEHGANDVTAAPGEVNLLDLSGLTVGDVLVADSPTTASWQPLATGMTIGDVITGGTANSVLFEDGSNQLAEDPTNFKYDPDTNTLEIRNVVIKGDLVHNDTDLPDMGMLQTSDKRGYTKKYITDKKIIHSYLGINNNTIDGGLRYSPASDNDSGLGEAQLYSEGVWNTFLTGIMIVINRLNPFHPDIEFTNITPWTLSLIDGNSNVKGVNGLPLVQNMQTDMGAYPSPVLSDGGTF